MPVYNGQKFMAPAIESVLSQAFSDFELLLIDDGSTDSSLDIASRYASSDDRVHVHAFAENEGVVAALNMGLRIAIAPLIARLDQDDVALPDRLEEQVHFLKGHSDVALLGSGMLTMNAAHEFGWERHFPETDAQIRFGSMFNNVIADPTVMCRSEVISRHALRYDQAYNGAEDYAFWTTLMRYGKAHNLQQPLVGYRIHGGQMSNVFASEQRAASDRISSALLSDTDPETSFTWAEKQSLMWLYRQYLIYCMEGRMTAKAFAADIHSVLTIRPDDMTPERRTRLHVLEDLQRRRALQRLAEHFVRRHEFDDHFLSALAQC
jgi:glycosyltransferase involved in cell wall biosynthesis